MPVYPVTTWAHVSSPSWGWGWVGGQHQIIKCFYFVRFVGGTECSFQYLGLFEIPIWPWYVHFQLNIRGQFKPNLVCYMHSGESVGIRILRTTPLSRKLGAGWVRTRIPGNGEVWWKEGMAAEHCLWVEVCAQFSHMKIEVCSSGPREGAKTRAHLLAQLIEHCAPIYKDPLALTRWVLFTFEHTFRLLSPPCLSTII